MGTWRALTTGERAEPKPVEHLVEIRAGVLARREDGERHRWLLAALLDVGLHELLGVVLQHFIDLVQ